jgi:hypothetical protein
MADYKNWWKSVIDNVLTKNVELVGIVIDPENVDVISAPLLSAGFVLNFQAPLSKTKHHLVSQRSEKDTLCVFERF